MKKPITLLLCLLIIACSSDKDDAPLSELTNLTITSTGSSTLVVNQTIQLAVNGIDQNEESFIIESPIDWVSSNTNASVDQNGIVTANEAGEVTITAETQGIMATYELSIEAIILTQVVINSLKGYKLDLNESTMLSVIGYDQINRVIEILPNISWSTNSTNVSLNEDGLVTGLTVGTAVITAKVENTQASYNISVWDSTAPRTEIYVSDVGVNRTGPHIIFKYDEDGGNGVKFITTNIKSPQDIVFLEDQKIVLISNLADNNITKHDIYTGDYKGIFANGINGPTRVEIGPDELIYVIQWNGGPVKRYQQDGTFVDDFTNTNVNQAIGITWDTNGNLYVSSFNGGANGYVKKFNAAGEDQGNFISSNLTGPTDIWFDEAGNLLVNDWSGNKVSKFDANGAFISNFITGLSQPEGVDFLDGNILIGNSGNGSVKMYSNNGTYIKDIVMPGAAGLTTTNAVTVRKVNQ